ncbi:MAG: ABC transporter permease [Planctomycetes bacterium]|nr:ABC transporter permease [Planctomycetota bacterium]
MNNTLHIAGREFSDNARTKGFWINLLMFPVILFASVKVPQLLEEKAKPTRHFVLVDQSGELESVVDGGLDRHYQRDVARKLVEYLQIHAMPEESEAEEKPNMADLLEQLPANAMDFNPTGDMSQSVIDMLDQLDPGIIAMLGEPGMLDGILAMMKPKLKPDAPDFEAPRHMLERAEMPEGAWGEIDPMTASKEEIVAHMKPFLLNQEKFSDHEDPLFALVVIPLDALQRLQGKDKPPIDPLIAPQLGVQFWSTNLTDKDLAQVVERALNHEVQGRELLARGLDGNEVQAAQSTKMLFATFDPKKAVGEEVVSVADTVRKWAPVGFVYLMWVAIFTVVNMLLNNTVEEKSNRIIEVLLSSATPWEIMSGKLIGIACVGLTMMVAWIFSLLGVLKFMAGPSVEWAGVLFEVIQTSGLLPLFALYFFCGYMTYSGLFLAIGSLCSTVKEAQNFMGTATIILMVPLFTMVFVTMDPHGTLATFLTWVPLYTPFVMMNRAAADPPMFDLIGTGILMLVTVILMLCSPVASSALAYCAPVSHRRFSS